MSDRYTKDGGTESTTDVAKEEASRLGEEVKREAGQVTDEAKRQGRELMNETKERLRQEADHQSERTASGLRSMSGELRSMADSSDEPQSNVAHWVRRGAEEIDSFAERLDHDGFDGVVRDVSGFARRNPTTFFAATFGVGLLAGRVMKNMNSGQSSQSDEQRYRSGQPSSYDSRSMTPDPARTPESPGLQQSSVATERLSP